MQEQAKEHDAHACTTHDIAVAVVTPSGVYPDDDDFRRAQGITRVEEILKLAADALKLTNTSDWVALACGRDIDPAKSFNANHLHGVVEIDWHKREGGGGARSFGQSKV